MSDTSIRHIRAARESANDDSYIVVEKLAAEGDFVDSGAHILSLEGSKATFEVATDAAGYLRFAVEVGSRVEIDAVLAQISSDVAQPLVIPEVATVVGPSSVSVADDLQTARFTQKAKALLVGKNIDLALFDGLELVTADDVGRVIEGAGQAGVDELGSDTRAVERIAILGAGRGCVQVIDILLQSRAQVPVRIYDDVKHGTDARLMGLGVSGKIDPTLLRDEYQAGVFDKVIISVSSSVKFRRATFEALTGLGIPFANAIHPSSSMGIGAIQGTGNVICAFVALGPLSRIGNNNFISAHCNIEHHCILGDNNSFGPGVVFSGLVRTGSGVRFGMGVFVEPLLTIGDDAVIASGSIILRNVDSSSVVKTQSNTTTRKTAR